MIIGGSDGGESHSRDSVDSTVRSAYLLAAVGVTDVPLGMDTLTPYSNGQGSEVVKETTEATAETHNMDEDGTSKASIFGGVEGIICTYSWDCTYWVEVARCESTLREKVDTNWPYIGLLQIDVSHAYPGRACEGLDLYDAADNVECAWRLSHGGTYTGPWPNCP